MDRMLFRAMTPDVDGLPAVGRSARALGIRVPRDIAPTADGFVEPGSGGLSVAPASMWNLPHHRRPRGLGRGSTGPATDRVYFVREAALEACAFSVRPDPRAPTIHAFVEPAWRMLLAQYEVSLMRTRPSLAQVWP